MSTNRTNTSRITKVIPFKHSYTIREMKKDEVIISNINSLKQQKVKILEKEKKYAESKVESFKTKKLKEIFELIYEKCKRFKDVNSIEKYGISTQVKETLIIPTLNYLKKNSLKFDFNNFSSIANSFI